MLGIALEAICNYFHCRALRNKKLIVVSYSLLHWTRGTDRELHSLLYWTRGTDRELQSALHYTRGTN
jgi:hypothetical protein